MSRFFFLLFTLVITINWAQTVKTRIQQVEQGLSFPTIALGGKGIDKKDIVTKLKEHNIPGASVAVIHNGQLDWSKGYGITDAKNPEQVTPETLFQCASIGKIITAIAALQLVEEGKLDLNENVNKKLKRWKIKENQYTQNQAVTLRHLLSHSAGLTDEYGFLGYPPTNEIPNLMEILNNDPKSNAKKPLSIENVPGKIEKYSGGGYLIVQLLIEDVTNMGFAEYVEQQIFDAVQMVNTTYDYQPDKNLGHSIARGHKSNGKVFKNKKYHLYPEKAAAGPWTTAEDLAKLAMAIQGAIHNKPNALLDQQLIAEFITPQINRKGLGVNLRGIEKPQAFWHAGQNLGFTGLFYALTEKGDGAIILVNSENGETMIQEFISSVASVYDWPVMKSYKAMEESESQKLALVGSYEDSITSKQLSIKLIKGELVVKVANSKSRAILYKIDENHYTFQNAQDYYRLRFTRENAEVTGLSYAESIGKIIALEKIQ